MMVSTRNLLFQGAPIFRFHVCFGGCTHCEPGFRLLPLYTLPRCLELPGFCEEILRAKAGEHLFKEPVSFCMMSLESIKSNVALRWMLKKTKELDIPRHPGPPGEDRCLNLQSYLLRFGF